jgi:hypothetical protein
MSDQTSPPGKASGRSPAPKLALPQMAFTHALVYAGPLNPPATTSLRGQLSFLNQPSQPQQNAAHLPCRGLLLILSSVGGNTFDMRSLYGLLRSLSYPIEIHATGAVKSSAVPLMLAADRRSAAPGTTFLFHPWTWGGEAHPGLTADGLQLNPMQLDDDIKWGKSILKEVVERKIPHGIMTWNIA